MWDFFSDTDPLFEAKMFSFFEGEQSDLLNPLPGILFIQEGKISIHSASTHTTLVEKGQMLLLSSGETYVLTYLADFRGLLIRIPDIETFCYRFFPSSVFREQVCFEGKPAVLTMGQHIQWAIENIEYYMRNNFPIPRC